MAKLETLPYELISEITSLLPYSTLASLCLTSRALYIKANPLLWRHLQLGPTAPQVFSNNPGFQMSPVLWPPYLRLCPPTAEKEKHEKMGVRTMDTRAILRFYTAVRKGWVRNQTFELIRSIELRDGVLRGYLEPFDNVGWWMNGEFHTLFQEMVKLGRFDGLTTIRIVYDRLLNTYRVPETEKIAIKKAQDFCRTVGSFAVAHPDTRIKISTTQFALIHSLFSEKPPPSTITSLKATLFRRPETIEFFSLYVLPNLQQCLQHLTILISMLDGSTPRHLIMPLFDDYSGEYHHYVGYTFDDETEFAQLSFPSLRSVEYAAELFGFLWAPKGIQRLCIRHHTIPEVRWWKELATNEMKGLERLEVWVDCEILSYNNVASTSSARGNCPNTWGQRTEVSFGDLKSLVIASNFSRFSDSHPNMEVIEGGVRPGDDNITGIPLDISRAIVDANPGLQHVFIESIDSEALKTLFSRGLVRSLTIQNPWGVDTQRRYCFPFSIESLVALRNCSSLEWLQLCVRDAYIRVGISRTLVELLAMYCRKLHWLVMEDRSQDGTALEVDEQFLVAETKVAMDLGKGGKDLIRWVRSVEVEGGLSPMPALSRQSVARAEYFVFDLDGFREG